MSSGFAAAAMALECDENGELANDAIAQLDALQMPLEAKVGNVMKYILSVEAEAEGIHAHSTRIAEMADSRRRKAKRLRQYVLDCMDLAGIGKVQTDIGTVAKQKNSRPSITVAEGQPVPLSLTKQLPRELDGNKAWEMWKDHPQDLPSQIVVKIGHHLRLR